jgi:pyridoxine 4-dehydrogenase
LTVNRIGLGTNRITDIPAAHDLLRRALELDINFIDTAYVYSDGNSEATIGATLVPYKPGLIIATKGGIASQRDGHGPMGSPKQLRSQLETSLRRLKVDSIDLYQLHRVDPEVPLAETVAALKQFQTEGLIRNIGLSEVTLEQLQEALTVVSIASVQNEYNVANRKHEVVVDFCSAHAIAFIPWFPLGGLRGDTVKVEAKVKAMAEKYGVSAQQIALAWLLRRSPMLLPIPGTVSINHLEDNLRAASVQLSNDDYIALSSQE